MKKGIFYTVAGLLIIGVTLGLSGVTESTTTTETTTQVTTPVTSVTTSTTIPMPQGYTTLKTKSFSVQNIRTSPSDIVLFNVPVMEESVDAAIAFLEETSGSTIYLVLNSPGGSVLAGARLLEYIKHSGKNIVTVCDNLCASMAFQIFEAGSRRLMTEKAILMAHPASGGAQGTIENMYAIIDMYKRYVDRMDADVATRSGLDYTKFKAMVSDNIWAETPEALALGLADGVVHLNVTSNFGVAGSSSVRNVMTALKISNKWNDEMLKVKGYILDIK